jgi:hypothetical protein
MGRFAEASRSWACIPIAASTIRGAFITMDAHSKAWAKPSEARAVYLRAVDAAAHRAALPAAPGGAMEPSGAEAARKLA